MNILSNLKCSFKLALLLSAGLLINTCGAQVFKIEPNAKTPWKSPSLASLQSMVLPGAGYLYQDKLVAGYSVMAGELILLGIGQYFYTKPVSFDGRLPSSVTDEIDRNRAIGSVFLSLGGAIHLFQFIHSGILAHKSNKVNGYVAISGRSVNAALSFNF